MCLILAAATPASCRHDAPPSTTPTRVQVGYPPPSEPPATVTPTPSPDEQGYMAVPMDIDTTVVALDESPYADLLVPLQAAMNDGSLAPLRNVVGYNTMTFLPIGCYENECIPQYLQVPDELDSAMAAAIDGPTNVILQGYFVETYAEAGISSICLELIAHRFGTTVPYPTPMAKPGEMGHLAISSPVTIDASMWRVCKGNEFWNWEAWHFGGYHEIVGGLAGMERPDLSEYVVLRP